MLYLLKALHGFTLGESGGILNQESFRYSKEHSGVSKQMYSKVD